MHRRSRSVGQPIPPVLVAQIGLEVARGLGYAHRLNVHGQPVGLVHRDVTPHNVLLSYEGAVKLTDFGIAKASNRASTAGMLKGKFAYMSPEQSRGEPVDARTDLFALGITLWELLAGGRLFDGDSDLAVLRAVQERDIVAPSSLNPGVDPALSDIIMGALQRDQARRLQSAAELERRLLTYVICATRAPEDTDVGRFVRSLFPDDAASDEDTEPRCRSSSCRGRSPTSAGPSTSARGAGLQETRRDVEGRLLQKTAPSAGKAPLEDEAFAPTQTPAARRFSAATAPGQGSAVTNAPGDDEAGRSPRELGAGRRRLTIVVLGVAVLLGVGGIAFVAGQRRAPARVRPHRPDPARGRARPAGTARGARTHTSPPRPTGRGDPTRSPLRASSWWGPSPGESSIVDGKFVVDVEEPGASRSRRAPTPSACRTERRSRTWTVEIETRKDRSRAEHSFLED